MNGPYKYFYLRKCINRDCLVTWFETILTSTLFTHKSCSKMSITVNSFAFSLLQNIFHENRLSQITRVLTLCTLSPVFELEGLRSQGSSFTFVGHLRRPCAISTLVPWKGNIHKTLKKYASH